MLENWVQPPKCMLSRNVTTVKTNISNQILEVPVVGNHPAGIKVERNVVIVVIPQLPKQCPAYGKECFKCKKKNHFSKHCQSSDKKPGGGVGKPKCFSRKDIHEVEKTRFKYDTDIVEFK